MEEETEEKKKQGEGMSQAGRIREERERTARRKGKKQGEEEGGDEEGGTKRGKVKGMREGAEGRREALRVSSLN